MDTGSFIYSRSPKTGSIIGNLKDLPEKYTFYVFCKAMNCPELFSKDIEIVLGQLKQNLKSLVINEFGALKVIIYA